MKIPISKTFQHSLARKRVQEHVQTLAESIGKLGLLNPITVSNCEYTDYGTTQQGYRVLAGGHRLEAAKLLGWTEIDATVIDVGDGDLKKRRMIEIAENLHRTEFTKLERAKLIAEWVEIVSCFHLAQVAPNENKRNDGQRTSQEIVGDGIFGASCAKIPRMPWMAGNALFTAFGLFYEQPLGRRLRTRNGGDCRR